MPRFCVCACACVRACVLMPQMGWGQEFWVSVSGLYPGTKIGECSSLNGSVCINWPAVKNKNHQSLLSFHFFTVSGNPLWIGSSSFTFTPIFPKDSLAMLLWPALVNKADVSQTLEGLVSVSKNKNKNIQIVKMEGSSVEIGIDSIFLQPFS